MNSFVQKFADKINGCIEGFDRIVFKGSIRNLMYAAGATGFFQRRGILNKDYKPWVMKQSQALVEAAEALSRKECGRGVGYIPSCHERKESLAHDRQREEGIRSGLIGVWSCVEACATYRARYDAAAGFPQLRIENSRCKHLYFYYDHADYGFLSVRLQTWFPFGVQIALNGREWLRRSLEKEGVEYVAHGNKFLHVGDYGKAQKLLDAQVDTRWAELLAGFLPETFSTMEQSLGPDLSYYWTLWQSEWATDCIFEDPAALRPLMDGLLRHALMTGTCERALRYLGRPVKANGQPHQKANPEILARANVWHEGIRIRHWVDRNSVKMYNEHNVLRAEMTMNNPGMFRVHRRPEGRPKTGAKRRMALRKGIGDIPVRTQVASDVNRRFMEQMATLHDDTPLRDLIKDVTLASAKQGRQVRALDLTGKDRAFLLAVADPQHVVSGITNKRLQEALGGSPWSRNGSARQLSARISRHLRLLRDHGLIRKMAGQRKYFLTAKGRSLTSAVNALLASSTQKLMEIAA